MIGIKDFNRGKILDATVEDTETIVERLKNWRKHGYQKISTRAVMDVFPIRHYAAYQILKDINPQEKKQHHIKLQEKYEEK